MPKRFNVYSFLFEMGYLIMKKILKLILTFFGNFMAAIYALGIFVWVLLVASYYISFIRDMTEPEYIFIFLIGLTAAFFANRSIYKSSGGEKPNFALYSIISLIPYFIVVVGFQRILYIASGV